MRLETLYIVAFIDYVIKKIMGCVIHELDKLYKIPYDVSDDGTLSPK